MIDKQTILAATNDDQAFKIVREHEGALERITKLSTQLDAVEAELASLKTRHANQTNVLLTLQTKRHQANNRKARRLAREMSGVRH